MNNVVHRPGQPSVPCDTRSRRIRDGVVAIVVVILLTALGVIVDFHDHFHAWTRRVEDWEADEFFSLLLITSIMGAWYTLRRYQDLQYEVARRQQVEVALRDSEARYRALVEGSLQGMCIHQNAVIRFANHRLATLFGYESPAQLIGRELWQLTTPHARALLTHSSHAGPNGAFAPALQEWQGRRQDGALRWLESLQVPLHWDGEPGFLMTMIDITERKQQDYVQQQLAYELHDGLAQLLVSAKYRLEGFAALVSPQEPQPKRLLENCLTSLGQAILETRRLMGRLRPVLLETLGLLPALHQYLKEMAEEANWTMEWQVDVADLALPAEHETALFRIVQEALHNARKHAESSKIALRWWREAPPGNMGMVCIQDWGKGFDLHSLPQDKQSFGLMSMRERARLVGGTCSIDSQPGRGTTVTVRFPLLP